MRCRKCSNKAVLGIPRHHTAFCGTCLTDFVSQQVVRAIKEEDMFTKADRVLVAVSGGKDSLTLLDVLHRLGYDVAGLYVDLGIGEYSRMSKSKVDRFTQTREIPLHVHEVLEKEGAGINDLSDRIHRPACSTCGTIKRYHFNRTAVEQGYAVLATGHAGGTAVADATLVDESSRRVADRDPSVVRAQQEGVPIVYSIGVLLYGRAAWVQTRDGSRIRRPGLVG